MTDLLIAIPSVQLHQTVQGQMTTLAKDEFQMFTSDGEEQVLAKVGSVAWQLSKSYPCLKSNDHTFVFSVDGRPDFFYLIELSPDTDPSVLHGLQAMLEQLTAFSISGTPAIAEGVPVESREASASAGPAPAAGAPSAADKVAQGLLAGSAFLAAGLVKVAEATAGAIEKGAQYAIQHTTPSQAPQIQMSEENKARLAKAKEYADKAANFTRTVVGSVVGNVATATRGAAESVSTSVSNSQAFKNMEAAHKDKLEAAKKVGTAALQGLSEVWSAMDRAGVKVISASTANISKFVEHKMPQRQA